MSNFIKALLAKEPLAVVNAVAAVITGFVAEAQGDLTGQHAWIAVGWALIALASRQFVSPAR